MKMSKGWKRFLCAAVGVFSAAGVAGLLLPDYRDLSLLFFYSIPSNSFIPFPHEPALVYFGRSYHPAVAALAAVAGTMIACFVDYRAVNFAFRNARIRRTRESDVYKGAVYYFLKAPFFAIWFAALVPFIPFYIFRILSPASGYPLHRYVVAVFFGTISPVPALCSDRKPSESHPSHARRWGRVLHLRSPRFTGQIRICRPPPACSTVRPGRTLYTGRPRSGRKNGRRLRLTVCRSEFRNGAPRGHARHRQSAITMPCPISATPLYPRLSQNRPAFRPSKATDW